MKNITHDRDDASRMQATAEGKGPNGTAATPPDPETLKKLAPRIAEVRSRLRENFAQVTMTMMGLPRYRDQTLGDLRHLVFEPLVRDRIAIAYPGTTETPELVDMVGFAIWASVSEEADARIREQIRSGVFPVRLKPEDWTSGSINWLLDVVAPDEKTATSVLANFKQVIKTGDLRLHPLISKLVSKDTLAKMGAERMGGAPVADPSVVDEAKPS